MIGNPFGLFLKIIYSDDDKNKSLENYIFGRNDIEKQWCLNCEVNKDKINNTIEMYNNKLLEEFKGAKDDEYKKNIEQIIEKNNVIFKLKSKFP